MVATSAFNELNQPVNPESRVTTDQEMNMVRHNLKLDAFLPSLFNNLQDDSFEPRIYRGNQNFTAVFRTENQVVVAFIGNVMVAFQFCIDRIDYTATLRLAQRVYWFITAGCIPIVKTRGISPHKG